MATQFGQVSIQLLDALGVTVSAPIYVNIDDTKTVAQVITDAHVVATDFDAITDSQETQIEMKFVVPLPTIGIKTSPASTAENERTGVLNFSQLGSRYKFGVVIPAVADHVLSAGKIDLTNADINTFVSLLETSLTALSFVTTSIRALVRLIDALISFRKHRKAESRRSFEVN